MAREILREELLQIRDALCLTRTVEAGGAPRRLVALHDERARRLVERVRVPLEDAVGVLHEDERERLEPQVGPEPHVLALAGTSMVGAKSFFPPFADPAVHAVGAEHEVVVAHDAFDVRVVDLTARTRPRTPSSAQRRCKMRQEALVRATPGKPMPGRVNTLAFDEDVDRVGSQWQNALAMASCVGLSAASKFESVSSLNTTPQPNVCMGALRSKRTMSSSGCAFLRRIAK